MKYNTNIAVIIAVIAAFSFTSCEKAKHAKNEAAEEVTDKSKAAGEEVRHAANKAAEEVRHKAAKASQ
jgi:hypothetical protein